MYTGVEMDTPSVEIEPISSPPHDLSRYLPAEFRSLENPKDRLASDRQGLHD